MPPGGTETREGPKLARKRAPSVCKSRAMSDPRLPFLPLVALLNVPLERFLPPPPLTPAERAWIRSEEALFEHAMSAINRLEQRYAHERKILEAYVSRMHFVHSVRELGSE